MTFGDRRASSPIPPAASTVTPSSNEMIRQSTSGKGGPIDPERFSPSNGLQCVAVGASDRPNPSTNLPPVNASKRSLVSRRRGAEPEMQALIEVSLYLPAATSGWLLMALYIVGTPGKTVG